MPEIIKSAAVLDAEAYSERLKQQIEGVATPGANESDCAIIGMAVNAALIAIMSDHVKMFTEELCGFLVHVLKCGTNSDSESTPEGEVQFPEELEVG